VSKKKTPLPKTTSRCTEFPYNALSFQAAGLKTVWSNLPEQDFNRLLRLPTLHPSL